MVTISPRFRQPGSVRKKQGEAEFQLARFFLAAHDIDRAIFVSSQKKFDEVQLFLAAHDFDRGFLKIRPLILAKTSSPLPENLVLLFGGLAHLVGLRIVFSYRRCACMGFCKHQSVRALVAQGIRYTIGLVLKQISHGAVDRRTANRT